MTTFYWPTDDFAEYRLKRLNRLPPTTPGVDAVAPYPRPNPVGRESQPPATRLDQQPVPVIDRRVRVDRRRTDVRVLFDRRSGGDRRAMAATKPRIDVYC